MPRTEAVSEALMSVGMNTIAVAGDAARDIEKLRTPVRLAGRDVVLAEKSLDEIVAMMDQDAVDMAAIRAAIVTAQTRCSHAECHLRHADCGAHALVLTLHDFLTRHRRVMKMTGTLGSFGAAEEAVYA